MIMLADFSSERAAQLETDLLRQATLRLWVMPMRVLPLGLRAAASLCSPAVFLSWLGMISAMLSISFANTKFCSSFLNSCINMTTSVNDANHHSATDPSAS